MTLLLFYFAWILVANTELISVKVFPFPPHSEAVPVSFALFITFFIGFMLSGAYAAFELFKQNRKLKKLSKQNLLLEKEIENLRREPIMDETDNIEENSAGSADNSDFDTPLDEETLNRIR